MPNKDYVYVKINDDHLKNKFARYLTSALSRVRKQQRVVILVESGQRGRGQKQRRRRRTRLGAVNFIRIGRQISGHRDAVESVWSRRPGCYTRRECSGHQPVIVYNVMTRPDKNSVQFILVCSEEIFQTRQVSVLIRQFITL